MHTIFLFLKIRFSNLNRTILNSFLFFNYNFGSSFKNFFLFRSPLNFTYVRFIDNDSYTFARILLSTESFNIFRSKFSSFSLTKHLRCNPFFFHLCFYFFIFFDFFIHVFDIFINKTTSI